MSQTLARAVPVGAEPIAAPPDRAARRHLHQLDIVRVLTFGCVIAVHVVASTTDGGSVVANGVLMLLRFTRETFVVLTGFVLMHSYGRRPLRLRRFWARRCLLVGVPYVAWSVIYFVISRDGQPAEPWPTLLRQFMTALAEGSAWYHLYFLVVSLQIYLLFPLLLWVLRATRGHHRLVLGVSLAIQLALTWIYMYRPPTSGVPGALMSQSSALVISYQFYVLLGALAAMHIDRMHEWVCRHLRLVAVGVVLIAALTEGWYLLAQRSSHQPWVAASPLQPAMLPWSVAVTVGLYALGISWVRVRRETSVFSRAVAVSSDRSFGVFLCHPAVLWVVLAAGSGWLPRHLAAVWLTVVAYLLTVLGALAVTELLRRGKLSLLLTGRPRLSRKSVDRSLAATRWHRDRMPRVSSNDVLESSTTTTVA